MAAKRIAGSSINWAALAERVPPAQKTQFTAFKAKSDKYLRAVLANPEQSPKIDWAYYKRTISVPGLVDNFQKQYEALSIPYPPDTVSSSIEAQAKEVAADIKKFCEQSNARISNFQKEVAAINALIPFEEMTMEDFKDAYPDVAYDPLNKPTFWPHYPETQPEALEKEFAGQEHH